MNGVIVLVCASSLSGYLVPFPYVSLEEQLARKTHTQVTQQIDRFDIRCSNDPMPLNCVNKQPKSSFPCQRGLVNMPIVYQSDNYGR
jgi:hypothetical protein